MLVFSLEIDVYTQDSIKHRQLYRSKTTRSVPIPDSCLNLLNTNALHHSYTTIKLSVKYLQAPQWDPTISRSHYGCHTGLETTEKFSRLSYSPQTSNATPWQLTNHSRFQATPKNQQVNRPTQLAMTSSIPITFHTYYHDGPKIFEGVALTINVKFTDSADSVESRFLHQLPEDLRYLVSLRFQNGEGKKVVPNLVGMKGQDVVHVHIRSNAQRELVIVGKKRCAKEADLTVYGAYTGAAC